MEHTTYGENVVSHGEIIYTGPKAAQFAAALDEINRLEVELDIACRKANDIRNEAFTHAHQRCEYKQPLHGE
jgi:hypothetical protein